MGPQAGGQTEPRAGGMSGEQGGYSPVAAQHAQNPRNYGRLAHADGHARVTGPCGDTMEFWVSVREGKLHRCTFVTDGCGPSLASGSVATELATGGSVEDALKIGQKEILEALGGLPTDVQHCALLAANTLQEACRSRNCRVPKDDGKDPAAVERRKGESEQDYADRQKLHRRLSRIRHKVLVLSGKGGVGKSTVAVNLAMALMMAGKRVGLLDVDIHGPSLPTMLGLEGEQIVAEAESLLPVELGELKVMSIGFLLERREEAIIWRGPMKMGVIKQFLRDVEWGDLDYLIVDAPPGTGDEPLSVCQLIEDADGAIIVTTPQEVALASVRKSLTFCRRLSLQVLGVVENMSGFVCPHCGRQTAIFLSGGGERMAAEMRVPFLGRIPLEPGIPLSADAGRPFVEGPPDSVTARAFAGIVRAILDTEPAAALDAAAPADHEGKK
jgi:ATP-binding protein involved in chromosome partitioning